MQREVIVNKILSNALVEVRNYKMRKHIYSRVKESTKSIVLTKEQKKEIKDFYSKYGKVSWEFHNFYLEKTGIFDVNYIPDDIYYTKIGRFYDDYLASTIVDNKCDYPRLFPGVSQPKLVACKKGGYWFVGDQIMSFEQAIDILQEEESLFIKSATSSCGGQGVKFIEKNQCEDYRQKIKDVIERMNGDIAIQQPIVQHSDFGKLNESSVNTLRILSILRNGEVKIYSSVIRIGAAGAKVDNSCSGGMSVGITEEGKLKEYAYYFSGQRFTSHPDNGIVFKGYQLPSFDKAKELVKKAHLCIPHFKMVSWDIAIGEDGEPVLIEANLADGAANFHQLNNGPLFGDDTKEILDEVFNK